jgi:hypothetical protein
MLHGMKIPALALLLTTCAMAQTQPDDNLDPARQRLAQALAKTQSLTHTAFTVQWKQPELPGAAPAEDDNAPAALQNMRKRMQAARSGTVHGSWHPDMLWLEFDNETADTLLLSGRWTLARDKERPWCLRTARFADGNPIPFLPDPLLLFRELAAMELTLTRRGIDAQEERPLEVLSLTLTHEQASRLQWAGLLPAGLLGGGDPMMAALMQRGMGAGERMAPPVPETPLDLAITIDPATGRLHRVHFRTWQQAMQLRAGTATVQVGFPPQGGRAQRKAESEPAKQATAPTLFDRGLPRREGDNLEPFDFEIVLQRHGEQPAPELDAAMKQLLGR